MSSNTAFQSLLIYGIVILIDFSSQVAVCDRLELFCWFNFHDSLGCVCFEVCLLKWWTPLMTGRWALLNRKAYEFSNRASMKFYSSLHRPATLSSTFSPLNTLKSTLRNTSFDPLSFFTTAWLESESGKQIKSRFFKIASLMNKCTQAALANPLLISSWHWTSDNCAATLRLSLTAKLKFENLLLWFLSQFKSRKRCYFILTHIFNT